jgi:hypothetical protein
VNYTLATYCLALFCVLGVFDGLYFHMLRFKLHARAESRTEHLIHTVRAFVFVPIAILFFAYDTKGPALLAGLFIVVADLGLEIVDILIEKKSRETIGGISSAESAIHVFASSFRMAALAFVMSEKPLSDFSFAGESTYIATPTHLHYLGIAFAGCTFIGGIGSLLAMGGGQPDSEGLESAVRNRGNK